MENGLKNICVHAPSGSRLIRKSDTLFVSEAFDSGERGNIWHRMNVSFLRKRGSMLRISIYTTDDDALILTNNSATFTKREENPSDILLHDAKGRYLWFEIELFRPNGITLNSITLSTPAQTLLNYLPEIYQAQGLNSFCDKFLSVFQTIYEDLEDQIANSSALYAPNSTSDEFISLMADWFDVEDKLLWSPQQLRQILKNIHFLHKLNGTTAALSLIVKIFCSTKPYLVESFHAMRYYNTNKDLARLYSLDRFSLWIILNCQLSDKEKTVLNHILQQNKPAHINARLVTLKPSVILGSYTYLGINSRLSHYLSATLNGNSTLGCTAI